MGITTHDLFFKEKIDEKVCGFILSNDVKQKVEILKLATNKTKSELAEDAIRLLYLVYSCIPKELMEPILDSLMDKDAKKCIKTVEEIESLLRRIL